MNISNIQQNKTTEATNRILVLRDDNIVTGKITKIYPNNQAEIQMGNHKIMAKVLTPLTIGERYFFQVQQTDQYVQLKVIGNALQSNQTENVTNLLQRLGLKVSKQSIQFVQSLINEKIPFNQTQITEAIRLLEGFTNSNSSIVQQILQYIIANKLPLTESVFQSLQVFQQNTVSGMMQEVITQLQQMSSLTNTQANILQSLQQLIQNVPSGTLEQMFSTLSSKQQQTLFNLMQRTGLMPQNYTFNEWNNQLQQLLTQGQNQLNTNQISIQIPEQILQSLFQLVSNRHEIQSVIQTMINTFYPLGASQTLNGTQFTVFRNVIQQQLFPLVPEHTQQQLQTIFQSTDQPTVQLHSFLSLLSQQSTVEVLQSLSAMFNNESSLLNTNHEQFLSYIRQYVSTVGLADEFNLSNQFKSNLQQIAQTLQLPTDHQAQSIKSMLLQIIQQGSQLGASDKDQQLVHFINGMQLQSIQESPHLLQALLQIPGEKFGSYGDMAMQFEGQKTEEGKLNPDFCRILFVLDLANIRETIIDMQVQKRMISMTIFNDRVNKQSVRPLEAKLKKDLESLAFHLSSINVKSLEERDEKPKNKIDRKSTRLNSSHVAI